MSTTHDDFRHARWGVWATLGWSVLLLGSFMLVQFGVWHAFAAYAQARDPSLTSGPSVFARHAGLVLALSTFATTGVCGALVVLIIQLRRGARLADYLAWRWIGWRAARFWFAASLVLVGVAEGVNYLADRPAVPDFLRLAYETAGSLPLLALAVVVAAPLFEELLFRGFLYAGLAGSRLRPAGAIVVSAFIWTVIHTQYDFFDLTQVFIGGLFLGWARARTGSVLLPFATHALWNAVAFFETAYFAGF
jgi:membrane protease YdiL (CAAX protease family)